MAKELNKIGLVTTSTASVSNAASSTVLAANDRRLYALIVNASSNGIFLNFGEDAVAGEGVFLAPNGFGFEIDSDFMWRGSVTAIASAGAANTISILEAQ